MKEFFVNISSQIVTATQAKIIRAIELSPQVLGAVLMFVFGWIVAELTARIIIATAEKLKLEFISNKIGLSHFLKRTKTKLTPSEVIASGVKGYLIFLFFIAATEIAQLDRVAQFLNDLLAYTPDLLIALFIMLVGIHIGHTMQRIISTSLSFAKTQTANVLGIAVKGIIVTFAILAALAQLQIAEILIQTLFIGFVAMITLAGGLAFGLGGKDVVKELLDAIKRVELKEIKQNHKK